MLKTKQRGERVSASEYNELVQMLTSQSPLEPVDYKTSAQLYGMPGADYPVYSIFGVYSGATLPDNESPVVNIGPIGSTSSGLPFALVTNGAYAAENGKRCPLSLIRFGQPLKFDVPTSDSGFSVGSPCGPKYNSVQMSSTGVGFVCLSAPITYQTSRKFVWAQREAMVGLVGKTTADIADGSTSPVASTITILSYEGTSLVADFTHTCYNIGSAITHGTGTRVLLIPTFGIGYVIANLGGSADLSGCVKNIRISGLKFQLTRDGTTWIDWGEGVECVSGGAP